MDDNNNDAVYDSVLTLALPFVTLTPNCFARVMISMRFLAETAWAILGYISKFD